MAEIKTKPIETKFYGLDAVVFTEEHTISDILRYTIQESCIEEIESLVCLIKEDLKVDKVT